MDPRVVGSSEDWRRKFDYETKLAGVMTRSTGALLTGQAIDSQLDRIAAQAKGPLAAVIANVGRKLKGEVVTSPAAAPEVRPWSLATVYRRASDLYADAENADAEPTAAQAAGASRVDAEFRAAVLRWRDLIGVELPALNGQLKAAGLPTLKLESRAAPKAADPEDDDIG
jgi:hypothetical protein